MNPITENLTTQFQEIYNGTPWLDETFEKKLGYINEENVFTQPIEALHSVAEVISHLLVWRIEILSRLNGNPKRISMSSPENWKSNSELKMGGWEELKTSFDKSQLDLLELLKNNNDEFLLTKFADTQYTHQYFLEGLLHHDLYHLGQIGITIKYLKKK